MDAIIVANEQSPLLTALGRSKEDSLAYKITHNYPSLSKNIVKVSGTPTSVAGADISGKSITFQLPRYGLLTGLTLESTITCTGNNTVWLTGDANRIHGPQGSSVFSRVELMSNNRVITSQSDSVCRVRAEGSNRGKYLNQVFNTDRVTNATAFSNSSVTVFTPFYSSFFESDLNYLDLRFCTPLQLTCTINNFADMGLAAALTNCETYLYISYVNLDEQKFNELENANFNPANPYTALSYSNFDETFAIPDNATSITVNPSCQYATYATHVFIKRTAFNVVNPILNLTVSMGGRAVYFQLPPQVFTDEDSESYLDFDGAFAGSVLTAAGSIWPATQPMVMVSGRRNKIVSIYWGLHTDRTYNSGAVSLHNVPNFQITATMAGVVGSQLKVISEYWQFVSINSAGGSVSVMASS